MAFPVNFPDANDVLGKPPSMTEEQCMDLPIFRGHTNLGGTPPLITSLLVSCWEFTDEEINEIIRTKRAYLGCVGVKTHPPLFITAIYPRENQATSQESTITT
jgi:hypothetical protein